MNKKTSTYQEGMKTHLKSLCIFLAFTLFSFLIFFYFVQEDVERNTEAIIINNVERQSVHFENIITLHFEYLEGIARYFSEDQNILSEDNLQLLKSFTDKSSLEILAIISPDGTSTYSNGQQRSVANRKYFQEAMAGHRAISDPVISKVDGASRIILAVPVFRNNEVVGVLGGSCDVSSLSHLLFSDIYDGSGYTWIVSSSGEIISRDTSDSNSPIITYDNFLDFYENTKLIGSASSNQFRDNFAAHHKGVMKLTQDKVTCYLAYQPLNLSNWFLCYVVPVSAAQESYQFISDYEFILFASIFIAMLLLLLTIFRSNSQKQQELLVFGQTDALTNVLNKQSTEDQINEWLSNEQCVGFQTFIMLDIDKFKVINDIHGHMIGDVILRELGLLLRREFRETDIVGRIGGDEFCILAKNNTSEYFAANRAERLCQHVRQHNFPDIPCHNITISVGVAISPQHGHSYNELYVSADKALYQTKRRGRNGYTIFDPEQADIENPEMSQMP